MITVPRSGQLLILHWYFWNRSSFVHTCVKCTFLSSLEHRDAHTDGIKRSQCDESPHGLRTLPHVLVLYFWEKSQEVSSLCPLYTHSDLGYKQTHLLRMPQAICGGAGNKIKISWILSSVLTSKAPFLTNQVYQTSHQTPICISAYPEICIPLRSWKRVCSLLPHPQKFDRVVKPA